MITSLGKSKKPEGYQFSFSDVVLVKHLTHPGQVVVGSSPSKLLNEILFQFFNRRRFDLSDGGHGGGQIVPGITQLDPEDPEEDPVQLQRPQTLNHLVSIRSRTTELL